jgi:hypothetical protein
VVAFGETLRDCENEWRSTLEYWTLVGLKLGHELPVVAGIDLNGRREPSRPVPAPRRPAAVASGAGGAAAGHSDHSWDGP